MLSHEEESSDLAAKANSTSWLTCDVFVYAVGKGKFVLKIQRALVKLEFLDDSSDLGIQGFPAHMSLPPPCFISGFQISFQNYSWLLLKVLLLFSEKLPRKLLSLVTLHESSKYLGSCCPE